LYASTDTTKKIETLTYNTVVNIAEANYPNDFWMDMVHDDDIEERRVRINESGQLMIFFKPSVDIPTTASITIKFPSGFDISNLTPVCRLGAGDMPHDNHLAPLAKDYRYT